MQKARMPERSRAEYPEKTYNDRKPSRRIMLKSKIIIIISLIALSLIIAFQNTEIVTFRFFFWTVSMSRILVIIGFLFIGFLLGLLAGYRRKI
jgi:uncharacterized integral membrane protein